MDPEKLAQQALQQGAAVAQQALGKVRQSQVGQKAQQAYGWTRVFMEKYFISVRAVCGEFLVTFLFIFVAVSCGANLQVAASLSFFIVLIQFSVKESRTRIRLPFALRLQLLH